MYFKKALLLVSSMIAMAPAMAALGAYTGPVNTWAVRYSVGTTNSVTNTYPSYGIQITGVAAAGCTSFTMAQPNSLDDVKYFYSLYTTAKTSKLNMSIGYDANACTITSFWLSPN
jgi:hypothetical protein